MERYEDKIEKALQYLKKPGILSPTGDKLLIYLVYNPEDVMTIRTITDTVLLPKAVFHGFKTHVVSLGELLDSYITNHELCADVWTDSSVEERDLYESIRQAIEQDQFFENKILEIEDECSSDPNTLIILKDVEMLHPFYMMGVIENKIYSKIKVPTLVLYPGEAQGTARSFLGVYNQDGNYRSINF